MKRFTIKATKADPPMEATYHLDIETKEEAEAQFKLLMPGYEITKVKRIEESITIEEGAPS